MNKASVVTNAEQEALSYMRIESEKAGCDLKDEALRRWVRLHWRDYLRARWLEHLRGTRFWIELDRGDFGLLQQLFLDHSLLVDRVLDRFEAGKENLDIVQWAIEWNIPIAPLLEILEALDLNGRRLAHRWDRLTLPQVTICSDFLAWQGGTIPRIARCIAEENVYGDLPVLGDALEEAGCADSIFLDHCRSGGPHAGWCWLVDLILEQC